MTLLPVIGTAAEVVRHVIVDRVPLDAWAVAAALAAIAAAIIGIATLLFAIRQTKLARSSLNAAKRELKLAENQLSATETASKQTQESLELSQKQLEYMQRADIARTRELAPRLTAQLKAGNLADKYIMDLTNSGAIASYVQVTGYDSDAQYHNKFIQKIDPGESVTLAEFYASLPVGSYCQKIRIRSKDVLGNKYITEYRSLGPTLAYPVFRIPWIGKGITERPERCSEEVSWKVEHFERVPGVPDEPVEEGFDINAPA